jgi:NADH-quinone oxidoreductase subunit G
MRHPQFAELRLLGAELARLTGATLGYIPEGANAAGASLAGALPHRDVAGRAVEKPGATAAEITGRPTHGLMLLGVEPELDCADGTAALAGMESAGFVLALSPFMGESLERHADIVLPMGTFAETDGTFVNAAGDWQSFKAAADAVGESRPGWKILRVLGNLLGMPDCDYESAQEICAELRGGIDDVRPDNAMAPEKAPERVSVGAVAGEELDVPMYRIDALVRRAESLQLTQDGLRATTASADDRKIA